MLDVVVRSIGDDYEVFPGVVNMYQCWDAKFIREHRKSAEGGIGHAGEVETSLMLYLTDLVDMSVADDTDIMTSKLKHCPTDPFSDRKKRLFLSTWHLEDSKYGAAGDPTPATKSFGEQIHLQSVDILADVITEFYEVQTRLQHTQ